MARKEQGSGARRAAPSSRESLRDRASDPASCKGVPVGPDCEHDEGEFHVTAAASRCGRGFSKQMLAENQKSGDNRDSFLSGRKGQPLDRRTHFLPPARGILLPTARGVLPRRRLGQVTPSVGMVLGIGRNERPRPTGENNERTVSDSQVSEIRPSAPKPSGRRRSLSRP